MIKQIKLRTTIILSLVVLTFILIAIYSSYPKLTKMQVEGDNFYIENTYMSDENKAYLTILESTYAKFLATDNLSERQMYEREYDEKVLTFTKRVFNQNKQDFQKYSVKLAEYRQTNSTKFLDRIIDELYISFFSYVQVQNYQDAGKSLSDLSILVKTDFFA